jgi:glycosyltransferase involved in cell wall biosynthesis
MLPFFIKHYRERFPECNIVVYDNESTDDTVKIAKENNCEVITYKTNNQISDSKYLEIKNNCWKNSKTNWNIVCDCDELCQITESDLIEEDAIGYSIIKLVGYDMINLSNEDTIILEDLNFGARNHMYDKCLIFNKEHISEINYHPGCHDVRPIGNIRCQTKDYRLLHYKYIGFDFLCKRYSLFYERLSDENKSRGWGIQYTKDIQSIKTTFEVKRIEAKQLW